MFLTIKKDADSALKENAKIGSIQSVSVSKSDNNSKNDVSVTGNGYGETASDNSGTSFGISETVQEALDTSNNLLSVGVSKSDKTILDQPDTEFSAEAETGNDDTTVLNESDPESMEYFGFASDGFLANERTGFSQ